MLSTPWSLGFVLAAILGAMLVPGCRPDEGPSEWSEVLTQARTLVTEAERTLTVLATGK